MKKGSNISVFIKKTGYILLTILCFTACAENTWEDNTSHAEEGTPVSINLQFQTSIAEKVSTRTLTDEGEFQVNDLYLLIFDKTGNRKTGSNYYGTSALAGFGHTNGNQANPTKGVITNLQTTSGKSYIYAIANVTDNELSRNKNLKTQLDNLSSLSELKKLVTTLNNDGNIARSSAALLMSGAFQATNATDNEKTEGICTIPVTNGPISGKLYLRRLDSHITFNIKLGTKIQSFKLESWQVCNVPTNSYLIDQKTQYIEAKYANSSEQKEYNNEGDGKTYSFNFYMQENFKKALTAKETVDGTVISSYKDREKEIKNADLTNSGIYKYVESNATFVEIKAKMNIQPNGTNKLRTADVKYTIHLGGGETDYANFNSLRNKKYIYTVTIVDVENIIVEVQLGEDAPNARPGAEGNVVDAQAEAYTLDAHYNCFNIGFTYEDIVNNLSFIIQSPFAPDALYSVKGNLGGMVNTVQENGDYKWIKLQRTDSPTNLARYKQDSNGNSITPLYLYDLVSDMQKLGKAGDGKTYFYTVFIDEYYYNEAPTAATRSTWKEPLWRNFVNVEDRKLLLFLGTNYSRDKESSYSVAKYMIRQKSIQTYYSTEVFNDDKNALGLEHINETGAPNWDGTIRNSYWYRYYVTPNGWSSSNGFSNTNRYFYVLNTTDAANVSLADRRLWSTFVNFTTSPSFPYTYSMKDVAAIAECLSRNRDENGNGVIDIDELKWYIPAIEQFMYLFLGAKSLSTPLFDDKSISSVAYDDGGNHYISSDKQKIWTEEGSSFGGFNNYGDSNYPKNLKCVRNLGMSNEIAKNKIIGPVYKYNSTNRVFSMNQLANQNKRAGKVSGELGFHDNFNDINRPYQAFQMASTFVGRGYVTWAEYFDIGQSRSTKCKDLTEGGKVWRAPNQREFMVMFLQSLGNVKDGNYNGFSRTHWKYNTKRHFGNEANLLFLDGGGDGTITNYNRTIRCVRDVDIDANGNIIE